MSAGRALLPATVLLAASTTAMAAKDRAEDLRWAWPADETRRIHVRSTVAMPQMLRLEQRNGTGVRITVIEVEYVALCSVEDERQAEWALRCPLEAVRFAGQPIREEMDRQALLSGIFNDYTERLSEAWLQVEVGKDGKLRHFDLEGAGESILGDRQETELMRRLFRQGFAGLEMVVPIRASGKRWETRNPRLAEHIASPGTTGYTAVDHHISDSDGDRVWIDSAGAGTMKPGPSRFLTLETMAETIFDKSRGMVEEARWAGFATPLPSHIRAYTELTRPYMFWGQARVAPLDAPILLQASGALNDVPVPDDLQAKMAENRRAKHAGTTSGVLTPPGRDPVESSRFATVRLGAAGGIGGAAGTLGQTIDLDLAGGIRWDEQIWTELGARVGMRFGDLLADDPTQASTDHDAFVHVAWSPDYDVTPHIGLVGGASYRRYTSGYPDWTIVPFGGVELGVRSRIGHGIWLDAWLRSTTDAGRWGPNNLAQWGGSTNLIFHRAGLSLVLGPGSDR